MKKLLPILALAALTVLTAACGGSGDKLSDVEKEMPSWYLNPPQDNTEFLYAVAQRSSTRKDLARQKAQTDANRDLAQKLGNKIEALQKSFQEEITSGSDANYSEAFTSATKSITNQELQGVQIENIKFKFDENTSQYECYVMAKLPVGEARSALENALSKEEELYVKFKESKAFEELQGDISRLGEDN
jgi:hypothetical protein